MATELLDTPHSAEDTVHSARYGEPVTDSDNTRDALAAIADIDDYETKIEQRRKDRDAAIVRMHREDGLRPTQIAKRLGHSTSNVRRVIELADARDQRDQR